MTITFTLHGVDYEADVGHYRPRGRAGLEDPGAEALLEVSEVRWWQDCPSCWPYEVSSRLCELCGDGGVVGGKVDAITATMTAAILDALVDEEPIGRWAREGDDD